MEIYISETVMKSAEKKDYVSEVTEDHRIITCELGPITNSTCMRISKENHFLYKFEEFAAKATFSIGKDPSKKTIAEKMGEVMANGYKRMKEEADTKFPEFKDFISQN